MLDPAKFTMPMLVANLISGYVTNYGVLMLAVTICTLPTGILFLVLQKSFAEGITGSVKGWEKCNKPRTAAKKQYHLAIGK